MHEPAPRPSDSDRSSCIEPPPHMRFGRWAVAIAVIALVAGLGASVASVMSQDVAPPAVDRAFARLAVRHLRAVDAALVKPMKQAGQRELRQLSADLEVQQARERAALNSADVRLRRDGLPYGEDGRFPRIAPPQSVAPADGGALAGGVIEAHRGLLELAAVQLASGADPVLLDLARSMKASRSAQIRAMQQWRRTADTG